MSQHQREMIGLLIGLKATEDANVSGASFFALEHRHPDGERWVELRRYPTKKLARHALDHLVKAGMAVEEEFRVEHVVISG